MKQQLIAYLDNLSTQITVKEIKALQAGISQLEEPSRETNQKPVTKSKKK